MIAYRSADCNGRRALLKKSGFYLPSLATPLGKNMDFLLRVANGTVTTPMLSQVEACPYYFDLNLGIPTLVILCELALDTYIDLADMEFVYGFGLSTAPDFTYLMHLLYRVNPNSTLVRFYSRFQKGVDMRLGNVSEDSAQVLYRSNLLAKLQVTAKLTEEEQLVLEELKCTANMVIAAERDLSTLGTHLDNLRKMARDNPILGEFEQVALNGSICSFLFVIEAVRAFKENKKAKAIARNERYSAK